MDVLHSNLQTESDIQVFFKMSLMLCVCCYIKIDVPFSNVVLILRRLCGVEKIRYCLALIILFIIMEEKILVF